MCDSSPTSHISTFILRQFEAEMCRVSGFMNALVPPVTAHIEAKKQETELVHVLLVADDD